MSIYAKPLPITPQAFDDEPVTKVNIAKKRVKNTAESIRAAIETDHEAARKAFAHGCPDLTGAMITIDVRPDGVTRLVIHRLPPGLLVEIPDPIAVEVAGEKLRRCVGDLCGLAVQMTTEPNQELKPQPKSAK